MDEPLRVTARVTIPPAELVERFSRSGGPGGQHVNTSDTRVELSYDVARSPALPETLRARALERLAGKLVDGVLTVTASDRRSQRQNRELARERLAETLRAAVAAPPRPRRPTRPGKGAVQARLDDKKRRGEVKRLRRDLGD
ncbi:MAG TPA: alternative ribosome rescue aminoacyl-tRNA hydrolase ArfB [Mycobacteriales bacterium]|nr:alternative ribosome rescue aminoacyl-tRNA hydrolase ArfB [Mycobacteriales bacterium]